MTSFKKFSIRCKLIAWAAPLVVISAMITPLNSIAQTYSQQKATPGIGMMSLPGTAPSDVILLNPSIPFKFSKVEKDSSGKWSLKPDMSIGVSYSIIFGKATQSVDGNWNVNPGFLFGLSIDAGARQKDQDLGLSLKFGLTLGIQSVGLYYGWDLLNDNAPVIGLGARVDMAAISEATSTFLKRP